MFLFPTAKKKNGKRLVAYAKCSGDENTVPIYSNEISLAKVIFHQVRAVAFVSLWRPVGTDFFLPVIVGILVLALGLVGDWPGSLGNVWHKFTGHELLSSLF